MISKKIILVALMSAILAVGATPGQAADIRINLQQQEIN